MSTTEPTQPKYLACPQCRNWQELVTIERVLGECALVIRVEADGPFNEGSGSTEMDWDASETVGLKCLNCDWTHQGDDYETNLVEVVDAPDDEEEDDESENERLGALLAKALRGILDGLNLTEEQQLEAPTIVRDALMAAASHEVSALRVWNVFEEDRHDDVAVLTFSELEKARKYALARLNELSNSVQIMGLTREMIASNWVFYATYSVEGDSIRIVESVLR